MPGAVRGEGCTLWPSLTPGSQGAGGDLGQGFIIHITISHIKIEERKSQEGLGKMTGFLKPTFRLSGSSELGARSISLRVFYAELVRARLYSRSVILGVSVAAFSSEGSVISVSGSRGTGTDCSGI